MTAFFAAVMILLVLSSPASSRELLVSTELSSFARSCYSVCESRLRQGGKRAERQCVRDCQRRRDQMRGRGRR